MSRAVWILLASFAAYAGIEAAVFHTDLYPYFLRPDSSAGFLNTRLDNERTRPEHGPNQILAVGDSRMALVPRIANGLNSPYEFGTMGVAGTTPRCWYYLLRAADPTANHYSAIIITMESYDDADSFEDYRDRE